MSHRKLLQLLALLAALAATSAAQQDLLKYMSQMPKCAIACILQEAPRSACRTVTNTTCLCLDEPLRAATQTCLATTCESILDALAAARVDAEACQRPIRDRRPALFASIPIQVLAIVALCLRMYSKHVYSPSFGADDWVVASCLALYLPSFIIGTLLGRSVFGRDIWMVDPDDLTTALKFLYIAQTFYIVCLALSKIAILLFLVRIFPSKTFRRVTYLAIAFTALSATIVVFIQIFQCIPIKFNWEGWKGQFGRPHRCIDLNALALASAGLSFIQDVVILILPLPQLIRLQVSWRTKAGIILMFSLGIFILITSCIRLRFIFVFAKSSNPTWDYVDALIWSGAEISVSMIVVSLPAIRLLLTRVLPGVFRSVTSRTGATRASQKKGVGRGSIQRRSQIGGASPSNLEHRQQNSDVEKGQNTRAKPGSKVARLSLYNLGAGKRTDSNESEEALELGDRTRGEVCASAGRVESGESSPDFIHHDDDYRVESAIHVRTTTIVRSSDRG